MDFIDSIMINSIYYILIIITLIFTFFTIFFKIRKNNNILNYFSLAFIIISSFIISFGSVFVIDVLSDFQSLYLDYSLLHIIALAFVPIFIFIIISNCFVIFKDNLKLKTKKLIIKISSFLLAIQAYSLFLLEPDYLYLTEEAYESDYEVFSYYISNTFIWFVLFIIIAICISRYIASYQEKKLKKNKKNISK